MKDMTVKVRFAPSPTGFLHLGSARTALFNWLFARKHGGEFVLRIEDTDLERSDKKYEEDIISGLAWLGIQWDGPIYRQTERMGTYREHLEKLLASGRAFWCFHTKEELDAEQKEQQARKEAPRHICGHKPGTSAGHDRKGIIRLAVDSNSTRKVVFHDLIRGDIEWEERLLGDISLAKDLDAPLYNFAAVADDITMKISHVIRGEDHISNTPKQVLIYEALRTPVPQFAHLPLILAPDRTKLSKRYGAVSVIEYRKDYLPEALVNFLGSLGYTYSREILSKEEMAEEFDIAKVHKSAAVFNAEKLNWFNAEYVRKLTPAQLREVTGIENMQDAAVPLITQRLEKLSDISQFDFFWKRPEYETGLLLWKEATREQAQLSLEKVKKFLEAGGGQKAADLRRLFDELGERLGDRGLAYWPFRVAMTGREASPDPIDIADILSKEEVLTRIDFALKKLKQR